MAVAGDDYGNSAELRRSLPALVSTTHQIRRSGIKEVFVSRAAAAKHDRLNFGRVSGWCLYIYRT